MRERRFSVIARMPALRWLNKSEISSTERNAERWLIQLRIGSHRDNTERPKVYQTLVDTHCLLQPVLDLDLSSHHQVPSSLDQRWRVLTVGVNVHSRQSRLLRNLEHSYSLLCNHYCAFVHHKHYTCISVSLERSRRITSNAYKSVSL